MLFPTLPFAVFFAVVFALAWLSAPHNEWRKIILLLASWIFYGAWDGRFVLLLIVSALWNWLLAYLIDRTDGKALRRWLVLLGAAGNLGVLCGFKYYGLLSEMSHNLVRALGLQADWPLAQSLLPVGLSFYTFQGISYLVDVYRRRTRTGSLLDVTLLMSFFPHLVAGPIVRAADLLPQLAKRARLDRHMAAAGLLLITWGLFKKIVIASELGTTLVDPVFRDIHAASAGDALTATYAYAVQIYCDFSAYSDMAIGFAALLGYRFPFNFDQPYRAASLQEFWRRWHISLSSWLRDYLYIPLGGGRKGPLRQCLNLMITMVLGGLWHGPFVRFGVWGALHGGVLSTERVWRDAKPRSWPKLPRLVGVIVTFHVVCLGWIFFRAQTLGDGIDLIGRIGAGGWTFLALTPLCLLLIVLGLAMHALPPRALPRLAARAVALPAPVFGALIALAILAIDAARPPGVPPFIYYQF